MIRIKKQLFKDDQLRINNVKSYVETNLNADLKVEVLSKKFGYSCSTLKRHFHIQFNETVHHYILRSRMEAAKKLIVARTAPLSEISMLVGYESKSGFTHIFRKYFGYAPSLLLQQKITLTQTNNSLD